MELLFSVSYFANIINQFMKAGKSFLHTVMSDLQSKILPVIFGSIPQIASRLKANFDRSEIQEFDALLKPESELARKKYTKYALILFPNCQTNMSMLRASIGKSLFEFCERGFAHHQPSHWRASCKVPPPSPEIKVMPNWRHVQNYGKCYSSLKAALRQLQFW